MKKLQEARQIAQDVEELIMMQKAEIDYLRGIVYRYHKKHGEKVYTDSIDMLSDTSFHLTKDCEVKVTELPSRYQRILKLIEKLNQ